MLEIARIILFLLVLVTPSLAKEEVIELRLDRSGKPHVLRRAIDSEGIARLQLFDPQNKLVWTGTGHTVTPVDVDGDGIDEVILGGRGRGWFRWQDGDFKNCDWKGDQQETWDEIVGIWKSSTEAYLRIYHGHKHAPQPYLYIYGKPGVVTEIVRMNLDYPIDNGSFLFDYERRDGSKIEGRYKAPSRTVDVWDDKGWKAQWQRVPPPR